MVRMGKREVLGAIACVLGGLHPADASSCVPGFDYAVFTQGGIAVENHGTTDSYNSAVAPYAAGGCGGNMGTNGTTSGIVGLQNQATVCGTIATGSGGTVTTSGSASYTSPSLTLTSPVTLTPVTAPSLPSGGSASYSDNNTHVLAPGKSYSTISCSGPHTKIQLSAGTYVSGDIVMSQCSIELTSGPVVLYLTGKLDLSTNCTVNAPSSTGLPTNLVILGTSSATDVHMYSGAVVYAGIYTPSAGEIHIEQHSELYGAAVAQSYHGENYGEIHYDQALASTGAGSFACSASEVSRSSPVIATVSNQIAIVQGTFEMPSGSKTTIASTSDVASFAFPYIKGHMRARVASTVTTTASTFSSATILFDAGASGKIPSPTYSGCSSFTGACRHIFTNTNTIPSTGVTWHPTMVDLDDTNASAIGARIAPATAVTGIGASHWQTIVHTILSGKLGGVDRSTAAVIGASTVAGNAARPTIAYFGATDGMVHAVCASTGGTTATATNICPALGTELWAFLPGTQLPLIRTNSQRIDGSISVVDAFGDYASATGSGTKSWRTILSFQTGFSTGGKPGAYAIDVTDPASPVLLWEYSTPTSPSSQDFGTGLYVALGPAIVNGVRTNLAVAQTNNGGSGGAGVVLTALQLETGAKVWQFSYAFPTTPRGGSGNLPYPTTGIPGGAVGVDLSNAGYLTDYVMGDLYGDVWRIAAATGTSATGSTTPLFSFSSDKHPIGALPAIYSSGSKQYAAFVSGGYDDPTATSWSASTQYAIAVKLTPSSASLPLTEAASACATCDVMLAQSIAGLKGFAQALVVGTQLFLSADSADVSSSTYGASTSNTGSLITMDTGTASTSTVVIRAGGSSLVNSSTTLYSSSSNAQQQLSTSASTTTGAKVDPAAQPSVFRVLWMRMR